MITQVPTYNTTEEGGTWNTVGGFFSAVQIEGTFAGGTYSARWQTSQDDLGHVTIINKFSPPISTEFDNPQLVLFTWYWEGDPVNGQIWEETLEIDWVGTFVTQSFVSFVYEENDDVIQGVKLSEEMVTETLLQDTTSSVELSSYATLFTGRVAIDSASTQTTQSAWTYQNNDWRSTSLPATSLTTTTASGGSQVFLNNEVRFTNSVGNRRMVTIEVSESLGNTLLLVASDGLVLTNTQSFETGGIRGGEATTTLYGSIPFVVEPTLTINTFFPNKISFPFYYLGWVGGSVGSAATLVTTTALGQPTFSFGRTTTSIVDSAAIVFSDQIPAVTSGEIITSTSGFTDNALLNETTTTVEVFNVIRSGTTFTKLADYRTRSFGPAATTTRFNILSESVNTFAGANDFFDGVAGHSYSTEAVLRHFPSFVGTEGADVSVSITMVNTDLSLGPKQGFRSSLAQISSTYLQTLPFNVAGSSGNVGVSYENAGALAQLPAKAFLFAPKKAQEYAPISGSGSSSNFSMKFFGATQSRTSTVGTGITTETSSWRAGGQPSTFWAENSRKNIQGAPNPPAIDAFVLGGEGEAFLADGLYETYSGAGSGAQSGSDALFAGGWVSSFSSNNVTAYRPILFFPTTEGATAEKTSASFAANLSDQPIDD
jgi:hypothetical protein